jgi:hypothetical protein
MGLLYDTVIDAKRQKAIKELEAMNILKTKNGTAIYDLTYEDLMHEWRKAAFQAIDAACESGKWF